MLRVKDLGLKKYDWDKGFDREKYEKIDKENWDKVNKLDKDAKAKGEIVGRYIREGVADGDAIYLVIHATKDKVIIEHMGEICEYSVPYFGGGKEIDRDYAEQNIKWRDNWDKMVK